MSASLVGSEMCIRDRPSGEPLSHGGSAPGLFTALMSLGRGAERVRRPVSYTHLTLPTICSV
eukprot:6737551-Alexandrium_andersonii.AAC.1